MITGQDYIDNLNRELNEYPHFSKVDVYNEFERYVENKENLRRAIDFGVFHYDYIQYCTFMKDRKNAKKGENSLLQQQN